jgi:hypothetical protein
MRLKYTFSRCSFDVIFRFSSFVFHVISTRDDLHFVPLCLSINRPWELIDVPKYAFDLPSSCLELCLLFCRISGCEQPCKISQIIMDTGYR